MLVLTRKSGERIRIGGQIILTVLGASEHSVRCSIHVPEDILVLHRTRDGQTFVMTDEEVELLIDEVIDFGEEQTARVLAIRGRQVKLGVCAPPHVPIDREEIYMRKVAKALFG